MSVAERALGAPLLVAFAALAGGDAAGEGLPITVAAVALLLALLTLVLAAHRRTGTFAAAALAIFCIGLFISANDRPAPPVSSCRDPSELWRARVITVVGRAYNRAGELARPCVLQLSAERCGESWEPRAERIIARLGPGEALAHGDEIEVRLAVEPLALRRNPTDSDPEVVARLRGLSGRATAHSPYVFLQRATGLRAWMDRARDAAGARFESHLGAPLAAIAKALSAGDHSAVDDELRERWSSSGLAHLLSVSGLHVTFVATLAYLLATQLCLLVPGFTDRWSVRRAAALLALPPVLFFCLWAGARAPAVRATVMGGAFLVGLLVGRPSAVLNAVGLAGMLILVASPASLYDPGFLLSFVAILFLLFLPPLVSPRGFVARARRALAGLVLASLTASLATAPVTAYFFGRVSLVAPLTNLVGVPLGSAIATPLALAFTLLAPWSKALACVSGGALELSLRALDGIARLAAALPFSCVDVPAPTGWEAAAFYVALIALVLAPRNRQALMVAAAMLGSTAGSMMWRVSPSRHQGALSVLHPYVGQGDAALVRLPDGSVMLVDAGGALEPGGFDPGRRTLAPLLRRAGIHTIDLAVVTHPHPDHLEGFGYLSRHFAIHELWWSGNGAEAPTMHALLAAVAARGGRIRLAAELPPQLSRGGAVIEVLHPRPGAEAEGLPYDPALGDNDNSVVLRLTYGRRSFLLPGDIESVAEATIAQRLHASDVLKSPHHGSRTSSSAALLAAVRPRLVVISLGEHNTFGFPDPEVLARYQATHAIVLRTDTDGAIELWTDGEVLRARTAGGRQIDVAAPP